MRDTAPGFEAATLEEGEPYLMVYEDFAGQVTRRRILVRGSVPSVEGRPAYLDAYCLERHEIRTFRADRIREMIDGATGEVIADVGATVTALPVSRLAAAWPHRSGKPDPRARVVFTGKLAAFTRAGAARSAEQLGMAVDPEVSVRTTLLIAGEKPTQRKIKDAHEFGVPVHDEAHWLEMLRGQASCTNS
jgi:hypothetical protein